MKNTIISGIILLGIILCTIPVLTNLVKSTKNVPVYITQDEFAAWWWKHIQTCKVCKVGREITTCPIVEAKLKEVQPN